MAVLVEAQGEMLDNIEAQVSRSVEYVQAGTTALVDAKVRSCRTAQRVTGLRVSMRVDACSQM
jgi:t-SNARE complex subunit (syntaxin)